MLLELHILQNFAPANLNRDDTNAPKDCEFGGFRRARISSQCLKRAIRSDFARHELLPPDALSKRTKTVIDRVTELLVSPARSEDVARAVATYAVNAVGLGSKDGRTEYLLFLPERGIHQFEELLKTNWEELLEPAQAAAQPSTPGNKLDKKTRKREAKKGAADCLKNGIDILLDARQAADIALFGRMIADIANQNVDASCQVAHALSTNRVEMEFDFYTAVDEFAPPDNQGAGMMGTTEFNSSCFYRYANVDLNQLRENLGGDADLTVRAVEAFVRASVTAIPTGKQNSMAAHNPPSLIVAVVRDRGQWSLANAFVKPVRPDREHNSLIASSIIELDRYWGRLQQTYGSEALRYVGVVALEDV